MFGESDDGVFDFLRWQENGQRWKQTFRRSVSFVSPTYLSCEVSVFHHLVPETFEQRLHVLLVFLGTLSVVALIGEGDISNEQSHTIGDGGLGPRVDLKCSVNKK